MFCTKCGSKISDNEEFCTNCGARVNHSDNNEPIINKEALKSAADRLKSRSENAMAHLKDSASNFIPDMGASGNSTEAGIQSVFVDPNEQLIAKLGNDYLVNLLYSKIKTCNVLLSDRRVYLKGVFYNGNVRGFTKTTEEKVLDIEDVTGTGFIYSRLSWLVLILDIIVFIFGLSIAFSGFWQAALAALLVAVLGLYKIFKSMTTYFYIDYAGGKIFIDAKMIGLADVQDFHKQMRRIKDRIRGKA